MHQIACATEQCYVIEGSAIQQPSNQDRDVESGNAHPVHVAGDNGGERQRWVEVPAAHILRGVHQRRV